MKTVYAGDFDICTNEDITKQLISLFDYLKTVDENNNVTYTLVK